MYTFLSYFVPTETLCRPLLLNCVSLSVDIFKRNTSLRASSSIMASGRAGEKANEASRVRRAGASGEAARGTHVSYRVRGCRVTSRDSPR